MEKIFSFIKAFLCHYAIALGDVAERNVKGVIRVVFTMEARDL